MHHILQSFKHTSPWKRRAGKGGVPWGSRQGPLLAAAMLAVVLSFVSLSTMHMQDWQVHTCGELGFRQRFK
eukprot:9486702-Pyramimonas_sp.AAC.2